MGASNVSHINISSSKKMWEDDCEDRWEQIYFFPRLYFLLPQKIREDDCEDGWEQIYFLLPQKMWEDDCEDGWEQIYVSADSYFANREGAICAIRKRQ